MKIFISYRREDSIHQSGRIHEWLCRHFGNQNIFFDVDSIPPGVNWKSHLNDMVSRCDVLLVPIGDQWLRTMQERASDETDMVRYEIEAALGRGIPIIPLQVGSAEMPNAKNLPEPIRELTNYQGLSIRPGPDFHNDMTRLISALEKRFGKPQSVTHGDPSSTPVASPDGISDATRSGVVTKTRDTDALETKPRTLRMAVTKAIPWTVGSYVILMIVVASAGQSSAIANGFSLFVAAYIFVIATVLFRETRVVVRFADRHAFINRVSENAQKSHMTFPGIVYAFRLVSEEPERLVFENMYGRLHVLLRDNHAILVGQAHAINVIGKKVQRC